MDLAVPLLVGADDARRPYSLGELAQLGAPAPGPAVFEALTPVPVDSVIAIDFAAAVTDGLGTGETTPFAASRQENGELYADYEVVEVGVRRRARYGLDAGVWTTLVAPEDTSTAAVDPVNDTVDELVAKFTSELGFRWDRDLVRRRQARRAAAAAQRRDAVHPHERKPDRRRRAAQRPERDVLRQAPVDAVGDARL